MNVRIRMAQWINCSLHNSWFLAWESLRREMWPNRSVMSLSKVTNGPRTRWRYTSSSSSPSLPTQFRWRCIYILCDIVFARSRTEHHLFLYFPSYIDSFRNCRKDSRCEACHWTVPSCVQQGTAWPLLPCSMYIWLLCTLQIYIYIYCILIEWMIERFFKR